MLCGCCGWLVLGLVFGGRGGRAFGITLNRRVRGLLSLGRRIVKVLGFPRGTKLPSNRGLWYFRDRIA